MNSDFLQSWPWNWYGFYGAATESGIAPGFEECCGEWASIPERDQVVKYLRGGPEIIHINLWPIRPCPWCGVASVDSLKTFSDGTWVWPASLAHEVEKHGVILPDRFLAHIRSQNYLPPERCDVTFEKLPYPKFLKPSSRWKQFWNSIRSFIPCAKSSTHSR